MHAYLFIAADLAIAMSMAVFFLVQPFVLLAERALGVRRWTAGAGRLWTACVLVALLPLLLPPFLFLFDTSL